MLTRIFFIGLVAGTIAGAAAATVQAALMQPQIAHAEALVDAEAVHGEKAHSGANLKADHSHDRSEEPSPDPRQRQLGTAIAIVFTAIGYGLMLSGLIALGQRRGWRSGLLFGAVGFVSMQVAPALGAPPQPPGLASHDVHVAQLWWLLAASCTAAACLLGIHAVQVRRSTWLALCVALAIALVPHVVRPGLSAMGPLPDAGQLMSAFALSSFATAAVLWLSLGALVGALHSRTFSPS